MIKVILPEGDSPLMQIKESLKIIREIDKCFEKKEKMGLDLSEIRWVLPCSAILISGKLMEIVSKGAEVNYFPPKNQRVKDWLLEIGFPLGKKEDGLTFVSIKHFSNNPDNRSQVNEQSNALINSMENKIPNTFGSSVKYILGELADNMDEHSKFTFASLMAQYYPKKEYLDIVVLDNGITIPLNFERNNISFDKDSEAIKKALFGEATTKKDEGMRGYGLKSCKDISINGINGEFHIISRKGIAIFNFHKEPEFYDLEEVSLQGTFLYFRLPTPKKEINIYPYL